MLQHRARRRDTDLALALLLVRDDIITLTHRPLSCCAHPPPSPRHPARAHRDQLHALIGTTRDLGRRVIYTYMGWAQIKEMQSIEIFMKHPRSFCLSVDVPPFDHPPHPNFAHADWCGLNWKVEVAMTSSRYAVTQKNGLVS